jgi:hypothetical protein
VIIGCALAGLGDQLDYVKRCLDAGLANFIDKLSYHPYQPIPELNYESQMRAVRALVSSYKSVDIPNNPQAALCIRSGYLALRRIGDFFNIPYNPNPRFPTDPISVSREEFDALCQQLAEADIPLKLDREQAWRDFAGWRVNYDYVLLALAGMIMVPWSPWIGDRPIYFSRKTIIHKSKESTSTNQELKTP